MEHLSLDRDLAREHLHAEGIFSPDESQAMQHELERRKEEATRDSLTGLLNRRGFQEALDEAHEIAGVIVLDLDNFKQVNDKLGHDRGDNAIKMIADILNSSVRENDIVARVGGDEFVIVLNNNSAMSMAQAVGDHEKRTTALTEKAVINTLPLVIASRLRREMVLSQNTDLREMAFPLGVTSVGCSATKATLEEAIKKADDEVRAIKSQRSVDKSYR